MGKVLTFNDFSKMGAPSKSGEALEGHSSNSDLKHYMFFQNLVTLKHYLDEIMSMDKSKIDALLGQGHDWAIDHLSTSVDDLEEITNWLRSEIEMSGENDVDQMSATITATDTIPADLLGGEEVVKTELDMIDDEKEDDEDEKEDEGEGEEGDEE